MDIVVTGSIAYDYLMRFPGKFQDHLLIDKLDKISVSFLVEDMSRHWGGVAANIAYNLALLGQRPRLMGTVGKDFADYRAWLSSPLSAMHAVIFAYAWKLVPFVIIILYAGLNAIPTEQYESAELDGAGDWARFRYITLPLLAAPLGVAVMFCMVWSMRAFDIVYLLTRGGPGDGTMVLSYFVFSKAFEFGDMGAAAAVACLLALLTFALTALYMRALRGAGAKQ